MFLYPICLYPVSPLPVYFQYLLFYIAMGTPPGSRSALHVITKASQTFNVHAHRSSLPECTKHQPSIIQYINIRKLLSRIFFIFFTLNCHGCPTGSRSALIFRHLRLWRQPLPKIKYGESKDNIKTRRRFSQMFLWYGLA